MNSIWLFNLIKFRNLIGNFFTETAQRSVYGLKQVVTKFSGSGK
jgi:hypothetical protein